MQRWLAHPLAPVAAGVFSMVLFSGNFVVARLGLNAGLSVLDLLMLRYAGGALLFWPVLWRLGLGGLTWPRAVLLALLAGAPYFFLTTAALEYVPAVHASILNPGSTMLCGPLLGWLLLRQMPPLGVRIGVPVLALGLLLVGGESLLAAETGAQAWLGDLLLLASGMTWALYGALLRLWRVEGLRGAAIAGALSLAYAPLHLALFGSATLLAAPAMALMQALWQGLVIGGLGFVLYSHALAVLGPSKGALFPPLNPVLGVLLAALVLGEAVTPIQVVGLVTVLAGMLCGALMRR